ncbi:hypothetical protein E1301_Tti011117 [Triplophysa tibetana]|uniref:Uncharacterized protein n=1 Tax=Triplophysa tibetana TaxID=1572043 RepID=A0A5A9NQR3_9TELE|nr:hypothetical protein E1301_Tti011117 [Triplophysa tibetana]
MRPSISKAHRRIEKRERERRQFTKAALKDQHHFKEALAECGATYANVNIAAATDGVYDNDHHQPHLNACQDDTCLLNDEKQVSTAALTLLHHGFVSSLHPKHHFAPDRQSEAIEERLAPE